MDRLRGHEKKEKIKITPFMNHKISNLPYQEPPGCLFTPQM